MRDEIHIKTSSASLRSDNQSAMTEVETMSEAEFLARLNLYFVKKALLELIDKIKAMHCE
jgi:hypothetical protein